MLEERYTGFVNPVGAADAEFEIALEIPAMPDVHANLSVVHRDGRWSFERGDFFAEWDPASRQGKIRQSPNSYSTEAVLRILHSLLLARRGGFLLHAASVIRNGKAFLFAGVSGAGKTTIARLAPPDATLLTDEISYIRKDASGYIACGTPFTGELQKLGENVSAPVAALFLLAKGPENRINAMDPAEAVRALLCNILFFAEDQDLVGTLFQTACEFVAGIPVARLSFAPDSRVWELIR